MSFRPSLSAAVAVLLTAFVFPYYGFAQAKPAVCDSECYPDGTSSTYQTTYVAKINTKNSRGSVSVLSTVAAPASATAAPVLAGSESYSYLIPIVNLPGRNGLNVDLTLFYNSAVWTVDQANGTATLNADKDFPSYGFHLGYGFIESPPVGSTFYTLTEPDGSKHELRLVSGSTYVTQDSSYMDWNRTTLLLRRRDGSQWTYQAVTGTHFFRPIKIQDTNGNFISIAYSTASGANMRAISTITDTVNRTISFNYDTSAAPKLQNITVTPSGGSAKTVAYFTWGTPTLKYNFSLSVTDTIATNSSINALVACAYPNGAGTGPGLSYAFNYGDWAIVNKISRLGASGTPRGYDRYDYPLASAGALADHPAFQHQFVSPDGTAGSEQTWTYAVTKSGGFTSSMSVTDPGSTTSTTSLYTSGWQTGLPSSITVSSGATTLRTITNSWTQDNTSLTVPANPRLSSTSTTLNDSGQFTSVSFLYDSNGNVTDLAENDFTGLSRKTHTDFLTASAYTSLHILNRPSKVQIYDAGNNLRSRTDLVYDGGTLTSVTAAPQHDNTNFGTSFTTRGNVTTATQYANAAAASGASSRNFTYDTLGNMLTAQADCCQLRQQVFSSTTNFAWPDSVTFGTGSTQVTTSATYDLATGVILTQTDANGQVLNLGYDALNRVTSTSGPLGVASTVVFDDNAAQPVTTQTSAVDTSKHLVQITTTDGLGRVIKQQSQDDAGANASSVETQYDSVGRVSQISNPHSSTETAVWTQNQYDALGRVVKVIPPDGSTSANNTQVSYSGNVATVTDPTGRARTIVNDAFGRLLQVREPGFGDNHPGQGSVTITGTEICNNISFSSVWYCDGGTVSVTVNGITEAYAWCGGAGFVTQTNGFQFPPPPCDTPTTVAAHLAAAINADLGMPVTATSSGGTISITAKITGPMTNYSLSASVTPGSGGFVPPSFASSTSGANLTGGVDGTGADGSQRSITTPIYTLYTYDPMDNLTGVTQGVQQRTFSYDSMSNLLSAVTPEEGTVTYTYNSFNLIGTRTDNRGVVTTFTYDTLNRLTQASYNVGTSGVPATSTVTFAYGTSSASNNNGRMTSMTDGTGNEAYSYDALGRVTGLTKTVGTTPYPLTIAYDIAGNITSLTYPSGRVVTQTYDTLERLTGVATGSTNYVSGIAYNSAWRPTGYSFGNSVAASLSYNSRLQPASLSYTKGAQTLFSLTYGYTQNSGNNGQITSITDGVDSGRTASYTYDALSRLASAQTSGSTNYPAWGLAWSYDRYGNRLAQSLTAGSAPTNSVSVDAASNRISTAGYAYDASGNITNDGVNAMTYNAENRIVTSSSGGVSSNYSYDGNGVRVSKQVGSATPTVYITLASKVLAEYASGTAASSPLREYIYNGSKLAAKIESGTTRYYQRDLLSNRVITDPTGAVVESLAHLPFGDGWYDTGSEKWRFTTYERDAESGNDYAVMRTYVNRLGRFSSPDPLSGSLDSPQSLDRYNYVGNNVINLTDPAGLIWGGEALCLIDDLGNVTTRCAKLNTGDPGAIVGQPGDPLMGIACGGFGSTGGSDTAGFCQGGSACPVFEIFACSGFGTANIALAGHLGGDIFTGPLLGYTVSIELRLVEKSDPTGPYIVLDRFDFGIFHPALSNRGLLIASKSPVPRVRPRSTPGSGALGIAQGMAFGNLEIYTPQPRCGKLGNNIAPGVAAASAGDPLWQLLLDATGGCKN